MAISGVSRACRIVVRKEREDETEWEDRRAGGREGDDVFRIRASFVKGLGRCQNQIRMHLTPSATSTIRESRTYAN